MAESDEIESKAVDVLTQISEKVEQLLKPEEVINQYLDVKKASIVLGIGTVFCFFYFSDHRFLKFWTVLAFGYSFYRVRASKKSKGDVSTSSEATSSDSSFEHSGDDSTADDGDVSGSEEKNLSSDEPTLEPKGLTGKLKEPDVLIKQYLEPQKSIPGVLGLGIILGLYFLSSPFFSR